MNTSEHPGPQGDFAEGQLSERDGFDILEFPEYDFDNLREDLLAEENGERLAGMLSGNMVAFYGAISNKESLYTRELYINEDIWNAHYESIEDTAQPNTMIEGILKATMAWALKDELAEGNTTGSRIYAGWFMDKPIYFDESIDLDLDNLDAQPRKYIRRFFVISKDLVDIFSRHYTLEEVNKAFANTPTEVRDEEFEAQLDRLFDLPVKTQPEAEVDEQAAPAVEALDFVVPKFNIIKTAKARHPTEIFGTFDMSVYVNYVPDPDRPEEEVFIKKEHVLLSKGNLAGKTDVLARMQSICIPSMVLRAADCDCDPQLETSMYMVSQNEQGLIILENDEGRGQGLTRKIQARNYKEEGYDTFQAVEKLGHKADIRSYEVSAFILGDVGAESYRLVTNNPKKVQAVEQAGIAVSGTVPIGIKPNELTERHQRAKAEAGFSTELADVRGLLWSRYGIST